MTVAWDYEESVDHYYHIYAPNGPLDERLDAIAIDIPQTPDNDRDIEAIVAILNKIEGRLG